MNSGVKNYLLEIQVPQRHQTQSSNLYAVRHETELNVIPRGLAIILLRAQWDTGKQNGQKGQPSSPTQIIFFLASAPIAAVAAAIVAVMGIKFRGAVPLNYIPSLFYFLRHSFAKLPRLSSNL